jgi:hypothetical protein
MRPHRLSPTLTVALFAAITGCPSSTEAPVASVPADAPAAPEPAEAGGYRSASCIAEGGPNAHDGYTEGGELFWGELHLHTAFSLDAWTFGTNTTPSDAYTYAREGDAFVVTGSRYPADFPVLDRPLDFVAVTDHSEFLAVTEGCIPNSSSYSQTHILGDANDCFEVRDQRHTIGLIDQEPLLDAICAASPADCAAEVEDSWQRTIDAANDAQDDCQFTALVGYEWTGMDDTRTLTNHRNVIFDDQPLGLPAAPFSAADEDAPLPTDLWTALATGCGDGLVACDAVTIPHNTNLSDGMSLVVWDNELQQHYQVAAEIYQHKGASECAPGGSEVECDFEDATPSYGAGPMSYLREGLTSGLELAADDPNLGNPLKLGFVGGTDGHNGAPGNVDEATWQGHAAAADDTPGERLTPAPNGEGGWRNGPGGITGVWAKENTRAEIFAAIKRRETYATSGPRIPLRVTATTDVDACSDPNFDRSHPMGSTLVGTADVPTEPMFRVEVAVDPLDQDVVADPSPARPANLAAVQLVRLRADGTTEVIPLPMEGVAEANGYSDPMPPAGGCVVVTAWGGETDPAFDPDEYSAYYFRVLQEPTYRWSKHACDTFSPGSEPAECTLALGREEVQERAWSSPIWYEPALETTCDPDDAGWSCHEVYTNDEDPEEQAVAAVISLWEPPAGGARPPAELYLAYETRDPADSVLPTPHRLYVDGYGCSAGDGCATATQLVTSRGLPEHIGEDVLFDQPMMPSMALYSDANGRALNILRRTRIDRAAAASTDPMLCGSGQAYADLDGPTEPGAFNLDLEHLLWTESAAPVSTTVDATDRGGACQDRGRSDIDLNPSGDWSACWRKGPPVGDGEIWCRREFQLAAPQVAAADVNFNHPTFELVGSTNTRALVYNSQDAGDPLPDPVVNFDLGPVHEEMGGAGWDHPDMTITSNNVVVVAWEVADPDEVAADEIKVAWCALSTGCDHPTTDPYTTEWFFDSVTLADGAQYAHVTSDGDRIVIAYTEDVDADVDVRRNRVKVATRCLAPYPGSNQPWAFEDTWVVTQPQEPANTDWSQSLMWGHSAVAMDRVDNALHVAWVEANQVQPLVVYGEDHYQPGYEADVYWASTAYDDCD